MAEFKIFQGATSPALEVELTPAPVDLTGATVTFSLARRHTRELIIDQGLCVVVNAAAGIVRYDWQAGDTNIAEWGLPAQFEVTFADGAEQTFPADGELLVNILSGLG